MDKSQLLQRLGKAWEALQAATMGLSDSEQLDTYGHYLQHADAIQKWREQRSAG